MTLAKPQEQRLITLDSYCWNPLGLSPEEHFFVTERALADAVATCNVQQVRVDKDKFYAGYRDLPPALFFCDADHSYEATLRDLQWAKEIGAEIICGDDYGDPSCPDVKRAVDEMGGPRVLVDCLFLL